MKAASRIQITRRLSLDPDELVFSFIRASGPGGQNVNKVSSAVQLRFNVTTSPSLPEPVKRRLLLLAGRRATAKGEIVISAQRFRAQEANRRDAVERLVNLIAAAAEVPKPRIATKPSRGARERRVEGKKRQSAKKHARRAAAWD